MQNSIPKNYPTGYYYYGCQGKMIDIKDVVMAKHYKVTKKSKKPKWKFVKKSTTVYTGSELNATDTDTGFNYQWVRQKETD